MRSLQDEIRQAQKELSCPICGRSFKLGDIQLRSNEDRNVVELSVICERSHFPVIMVVPVSLREISTAGPITRSELLRANKKIEGLHDSIQELYQ